jgi:hypothetical protein
MSRGHGAFRIHLPFTQRCKTARLHVSCFVAYESVMSMTFPGPLQWATSCAMPAPELSLPSTCGIPLCMVNATHHPSTMTTKPRPLFFVVIFFYLGLPRIEPSGSLEEQSINCVVSFGIHVEDARCALATTSMDP